MKKFGMTADVTRSLARLAESVRELAYDMSYDLKAVNVTVTTTTGHTIEINQDGHIVFEGTE